MSHVETVTISAILFVVLASACVAQEQPMEGRFTEAIAKRIESRMVEQEKAQQLMEGRLLDTVAAIRAEMQAGKRQAEEAQEAQRGIFQRIAAVVSSSENTLMDCRREQDSLFKRLQSWTPGQNLVNRLTALVWAAIALIVSVVILAFLVLGLYARVSRLVAGG